MNSIFFEHLQHVCSVLNQHGLEYLTIGGAAVSLHGYVRMSMNSSGQPSAVIDLDFWYNPNYTNYSKLLNALENLGEDVKDFRAEQTPEPRKSFFRIQRPERTLDFVPQVPGLPRFRDVYSARATTKLGDVEVPFISYEHLIQNKQTIGRLKDLEDIRQLRLLKSKRQQRPPRPR